jgi:hypothetical protein
LSANPSFCFPRISPNRPHFGDWLTWTYYTKYLGIHPDTKVRQKSIKLNASGIPAVCCSAKPEADGDNARGHRLSKFAWATTLGDRREMKKWPTSTQQPMTADS